MWKLKFLQFDEKEKASDPREELAAAHQSGRGYGGISQQSGLHFSAGRMIINKWKTLKGAGSLLRRACFKFDPKSECEMKHFG